MSRSRRGNSMLAGHDAFLDIVANLVGILIILVAVLGAQSQAVIREARDQPKTDIDPMNLTAGEAQWSELAATSSRAVSAQADSIRLEKTIQLLDAKIAKQSEQRTVLLAMLSEAEAAWEEEKKKLDQEKLAAAEKQATAVELRDELASLSAEQTRLENRKAPVVAVSHLPTPMAKTVFGEEINMRLKGNRLSVVPFDGLVREIERDLARIASSSRLGMVDSAVGPIRGYVARFVAERKNSTVSRDGAVARMASVRVVAAAFEPLEEGHGTPIQEVFQDQDWLDVALAGRSPDTTTVTVWVYPDSFSSFRKLKEKLYAKGFATAARPLEANLAITVSPRGTNSAAQ